MPNAHLRARPERIAHRGAPREFDENTLPGFLRSVERGADAVELDVHLTRDGQVVVSSEKPLSIALSRILLRHRTDEAAGLRSGAVTLWVWGVDPAGRVSSPVKGRFIVAWQD